MVFSRANHSKIFKGGLKMLKDRNDMTVAEKQQIDAWLSEQVDDE